MTCPSDWQSCARAPGFADLQAHLEVRSIALAPIPADCTHGFAGAYWRRPEAYLNPGVREGISSLAQLSPELVDRAVERLTEDLSSGAWDARYGALRSLPECNTNSVYEQRQWPVVRQAHHERRKPIRPERVEGLGLNASEVVG